MLHLLQCMTRQELRTLPDIIQGLPHVSWRCLLAGPPIYQQIEGSPGNHADALLVDDVACFNSAA